MKGCAPIKENAARIAQRYVEEYKSLPSMTLARKIMHDYPLVFKNLESARKAVRYRRGETGTQLKQNAVRSGVVVETTKKKTLTLLKTTKNIFDLPESIAPSRSDYVLPTSCTSILWMSDIHIPNHDAEALETAISYGVKNKVNCIVIGGDLLDNTPFSRFDHKPTLNDARQYFVDCIRFLTSLRRTFPSAKIVFMEGNHDSWYKHWLITKAPILFNDPYYQLSERLGLNNFKIDFVPEERLVRAGKLFFVHGHTLIRGVFAPVNAARGVFLRAKASTLIGHVHSTSNHSETNLKGDIINCYSVGCLCTLHPDYDPHNTKHNQGFAHIEIDQKTGEYFVRNYRIQNGKIY
jgi:predicted phosphodiesterase